VLSQKWGIWLGDAEAFLDALPPRLLFDLVVTSPPYNLGKPYEQKRDSLLTYLEWQRRIIGKIIPRIKPSGSLCWQVGNYVDNGQIVPLDIESAPFFCDTACGCATGSSGGSATGCTRTAASRAGTRPPARGALEVIERGEPNPNPLSGGVGEPLRCAQEVACQ
jgi:hypothetical protein